MLICITGETTDDESVFVTTAKDNTTEMKFDSPVQDFLTRDVPVVIRSISMEGGEQEQYLHFENDLDGMVLELTRLQGLRMTPRHFNFINKTRTNLKYISPMLKKHVDLPSLSSNSKRIFTNCLGIQLFYHNGWECYMALTPATESPAHLTKETVRLLTVEYFMRLRNTVRIRLQQAARTGMAQHTMAKNNVVMFEKLTILPDDSKVIFKILQDSMDECQAPNGLQKCLFAFRFGEKSSKPFRIGDDFHLEHINRMTIHVACNVTSTSEVDLLWSRAGIQKVIGTRGSVTPCLSLQECGNFQSNLDGRAVDISPQLRAVSTYPERLTFIQLYADLPHLRMPQGCRTHPVSGTICCGGILHNKTTEAMERNTMDYIATMMSNFINMTTSRCRLEMVIHIPNLLETIDPKHFIVQSAIQRLLQDNTMLVPFYRLSENQSLLQRTSAIGRYLLSKLDNLHKQFKGTGNKESTWLALQAELAMEKLVWGHPLDWRSHQVAIHIGPGVSYTTRSRTDDLGFLALNDTNQIVPPPPFAIWTGVPILQDRLQRWFGFHDFLDKSDTLLGKEVVHLLLQDLHATGKVFLPFGNFLVSLKGQNPNALPLTGSITANQLAKTLSEPRAVRYPMMFGKVLDLLRDKKRNIEALISHGIAELNLQNFPAIQLVDKHFNKIVDWKQSNKYWKILGTEAQLEEEKKSPLAMTQLVKTEMDRRGLVFASKLRSIKGSFPWISSSIAKLQRAKIPFEGLIRELVYISCIGLVMNEWYVDFAKLREMEKSLPVKPYNLRYFEIFSKVPLKQNEHFYRFHPSMARELTLHPSMPAKKEEEKEERESIHEIPQPEPEPEPVDEEDSVEEQNIVPFVSKVIPPNAIYRWKGEELELMHELATLKHQQPTWNNDMLYAKYKTMCSERNLPIRSMSAVINKMIRISVK